MKRIISLLLVTVLILGLCACGGSGESGKKVWVVDKDETEQTAMILL